jgi:hypothetical protein
LKVNIVGFVEVRFLLISSYWLMTMSLHVTGYILVPTMQGLLDRRTVVQAPTPGMV